MSNLKNIPGHKKALLPKSAVCVVLLDEQGKALAVSRRGNPTLFGFPGGKVDPGEFNLEAVVRETTEEVGIELEPELLEPLYSGLCPGKGPEDTYWVTTYLYKAAVDSSQTTRLEEGLSVAWLNPLDLCLADTSPFYRYNRRVLESLDNYQG